MWWKNDIVVQLRRIADALEKANAARDFSREDSAVLGETKTVEQAKGRVEEAKGRIPPRVPPATS